MKNLILILTFLFSSLQLFSQYYTEFIWDTVNFEEPYEYLTIDTSSQNIWQIGEPSKIFFDSAYSINKAIVTDTLNFYPINNNSHFDLLIGDFNFGYTNEDWFPYDIFIEIKHKFNTDTLKDGGFITVSYDNGNTWMNIIKDTVYNEGEATPAIENNNLYTENNILFNGEYGFSGNSNDWITTMFSWHFYATKYNNEFYGDTMIIRFNFISDNIENYKEGWMIDNIKLYSVDLGSNINKINPLEFSIQPNPMNETSTIFLNDYNKLKLSILNTYGEVIQKKEYFNNQTIIINKNELKSGVYFIKLTTDNNTTNVKKLIIR